MNGRKAAAANRLQAIRCSPIPLVILTIALALLAASGVLNRAPLIIWNASASVPIGFYRIYKGGPIVGSLVLVHPDSALANLALRRGYLLKAAYLLKPVAAVAGERVCRFGAHVFIHRRVVAHARAHDVVGRRMPAWTGCRRLGPGELFLIANHPDSFDGRYFGPIDAQQVIGIAVPVWPSYR